MPPDDAEAGTSLTPAGGWAIGPTWRRGPDGLWLLPRWSLGWAAIDWCSENLLTPDGPRAGEPWRFTPEQGRFLLWWYAIDETGRFLYRDGVLRRMKGWGKDPFAAALAWNEFLGPCRFAGWDSNGEPLARRSPAPWVQIASVSQDATKNTTDALKPMIGGKNGARRYGVELGKEVSHLDSGGRMEITTSSPSALEGNRPTFALRNETHLWTPARQGPDLAAVIDRNLAKGSDGSSRGLSITNAHVPGAQSVGEGEYEAMRLIAAGKSRATDILFDSLEAPPDTSLTDDDSLRRGLLAARGDSTWVPVDRLVATIHDPRTTASNARRFYLNQVQAADDALFDLWKWQQLAVDDRLRPGDTIALFFDGSHTGDHTGLVGCRLSDGLLGVLGHWNPQHYDGQVPRSDVDAVVHSTFERFNVVGFAADVRMWESHIDSWANAFGPTLKLWMGPRSGRHAHPIAWDMRGRLEEFSRATERFVDDVLDGSLRHPNDPNLNQHVENARRSLNRYGFSVRKKSVDSTDKIDLAVCAIGARMVRRAAFASGVDFSQPNYSAFAF